MDILRELELKLDIDDKPIYSLAERHAVSAVGLIEMEDQERAQLDEIIRQEKERCETIMGRPSWWSMRSDCSTRDPSSRGTDRGTLPCRR
jgi:hypothetical protein